MRDLDMPTSEKEKRIMAKQKEVKTNAMRILETMKIPFTCQTYECEEFVDGLQTAEAAEEEGT